MDIVQQNLRRIAEALAIPMSALRGEPRSTSSEVVERHRQRRARLDRELAPLSEAANRMANRIYCQVMFERYDWYARATVLALYDRYL